MRLLSIKLNNFRSYYGLHELQFASSEDKNVTLIHGAMGAGKTKLFSAIQWGFYGEEEYDEQNSTNKEIMNSIALTESQNKKSSEAEVEIVFGHDDIKYHAIRKFSAFDGEVENRDSFTLLKAEGRGDYVYIDDPEIEMNSILSKELRKYFMFDGEKIQNYSKSGHEIEIQRAIKGLLGFDDIEKTITILKKIEEEYNRDIQKTTKSRELQDVIEKVQKLKKDINGLAERITERENQIIQGQNLIQKLDKEQSAISKIKEHIDRQDELKEKLEVQKNNRDSLRSEIALKTDQIYLTMLESVTKEAKEIYASLEQQGKIPAPIQTEFVKRLLADEECICGRSLIQEKNQNEINLLLKILEEKNTELDNLVRKIPNDIADLKTMSEVTQFILSEKIKEDSRIQDDIGTTNEKLNTIREILKGSDIETVRLKQQEKLKIEEKLDQEKSDKIRDEVKKGTLEETLKSYEKTQNKLYETESETAELKRHKLYTTTIIEELSKLYKIYEEETKIKVTQLTQEIFDKFMWKKSHYKEVIIQDNYVLDVLDRNNRLAREGLSAGEKQCFSLAFVIALATVTGKSSVFIIDTPLGRISKDPGELIDPRVQILKSLPKLLDQVILFVTYEEVREGEDTEKAISEYVGKEYKLEYDKTNGCTRIITIK